LLKSALSGNLSAWNSAEEKMMRRIVIYHCFEIVKIPFPFTDQQAIKNWPALIISSAKSFNCYIDYSAIAMITSVKHSAWPLDTIISDLKSAGLPVASLIRLKLLPWIIV